MSVFDVEVDPKAIEAAAKDEPPDYIPTDDGPDEQGLAAPVVKEMTAEEGPTPDEKTVTVMTAAAVATAAAIVATTDASTTDTTSNVEKWKSFVAPRDEQDEDIHFPEPSMDDFFHEEEN